MNIPPCLCCGKELENIGDALPDHNINQPNDGLSFMTHGHFGSAEFDPMNPKVWLEINICDDCLIERADRVLHGTKLDNSFTVPVMYEKWNRHKHG